MTIDTRQPTWGELPTLSRWSGRGAVGFLVLALAVFAVSRGDHPGDTGYRIVVVSAVLSAVALALVQVLDRRVLADKPTPAVRPTTLLLAVLLVVQTVATVLLVALSLLPDGVGSDTAPVLVLGLLLLVGQTMAAVAAGRSWRFQRPR